VAAKPKPEVYAARQRQAAAKRQAGGSDTSRKHPAAEAQVKPNGPIILRRPT
jgi:hypothetical protein